MKPWALKGKNLLLKDQIHSFMSCLLLDGCMDDLRFYVLFNSISVISGQWAGDNERLCAMEPHLPLKRSSPQVRLEPGTARSVDQRLTQLATWALLLGTGGGGEKETDRTAFFQTVPIQKSLPPIQSCCMLENR